MRLFSLGCKSTPPILSMTRQNSISLFCNDLSCDLVHMDWENSMDCSELGQSILQRVSRIQYKIQKKMHCHWHNGGPNIPSPETWQDPYVSEDHRQMLLLYSTQTPTWVLLILLSWQVYGSWTVWKSPGYFATVRVMFNHKNTRNSCPWSSYFLSRRLLVSASQDGKLIIWDSYTTNKVRLFSEQTLIHRTLPTVANVSSSCRA